MQFPLTFVVGTGRSGSTALSRIINTHPDVLSLNEFFSSLGMNAFPAEPLTGEEFWNLLMKPHAYWDRLIRDGLPLPEFLYSGRYKAEDGIPALMHMALPHLADDPDELLDALEPVIRGLPSGTAAQHYECMFGFLCEHLDRRTVIERSGFSLRLVPKLAKNFPYARFVHLHREGPDCALSMSRHMGFRGAALMWKARVSSFKDLTQAHIDRHFPGLDGLEKPDFDLTRLRDYDLPVREFGAMWSQMITGGLRALEQVPREQRMSLSYESLIDEPRAELTRFARFAGIEPFPEWLDGGVALLDGGQRGASLRLPPEQLAALRKSCAPGTRALNRAVGRGFASRLDLARRSLAKLVGRKV